MVSGPLRPFWRLFWLRFTYVPPVLVTKYEERNGPAQAIAKTAAGFGMIIERDCTVSSYNGTPSAAEDAVCTRSILAEM